MSDPTLVAVIEKNRAEEIRVALTVYNGKPLIDVRIYSVFGDDPDPRPTKKGIALSRDKLGELIEALQAAERYFQ